VTTPTSTLETWLTITSVAATAVAGDTLIAAAMRRIGDLDDIRARAGLSGAIKAVTGSPLFLAGVTSMAISFFALLFTLSNVDVSLAAPASAAITNIGSTITAKFILKENVGRRRWLAVVFVCIGVYLLSK
jgi:drug/metabolite transporter (DMT)-like permease